MRTLNQQEYESLFSAKKDEALKHALDIRKFEIDLYWKRASYFWAFIGAVFAGYGAAQTISDPESRECLSVLASCLGLVFSFAWYCANRGSKQWQENWEFHTDLLEEAVVGPLYKVVIRSVPAPGFWPAIADAIVGAGSYSVTKINQVVSLFVTVVWVVILWFATPPFSLSRPINWLYVSIVGAAAVAVLLIHFLARTGQTDRQGTASQRESRLNNKNTS